MLSSLFSFLEKKPKTRGASFGNKDEIVGKNVTPVRLPRPADWYKFAVVVKDVFSKDECAAMIADTEARGYEKALVNIGGGRQMLDVDYRRSQRCMFDSVEQAQLLWEKVKQYVPSTWSYDGEDWKVVGLNERLRFLRYDPGDFFAPHFDGTYIRDNGEASFITLMIYLNDDFRGGETSFLDIASDAKVLHKPLTGQILLFQHNIYHSGEELTRGQKYALRTDVMFARVDKKEEAKTEEAGGGGAQGEDGRAAGVESDSEDLT
mmetsp:Transcript_5129/g.16305  ORF Transcript_5129/g.16305 Transcript_5129/m.16305 type:complete len:263 (-) Transcript_5129:520-1308(-)